VNRFGYIVSCDSRPTIVSMQQSGTAQLTRQRFTRNEWNEHVDKMKKYEVLIVKETGEDEPYLAFNGLKYLANLLIDNGSCTVGPECMLSYLQQLYEQMPPQSSRFKISKPVMCAMCAGKIGVKRCAACPKDSEIRYCSRACQVAAWPLHKKAECAGCRAEDVA
jgi:hypothetical protein